MSVEANKAVMRRADEFVNTGDPAAAADAFAVDCLDHSPLPGQPPGLEGIIYAIVTLQTAFPDLYLTTEELIAEGDRVAQRWTMRGTHQGTFLGIPATGNKITLTGIDILRIAKGQIVERRGEMDLFGLLQQLGALSAPGRPGEAVPHGAGART